MSFDPGQFPGAEAPRTPAGWYPVDHLSQRYWDGYEWTNHVAPLHPQGIPAATSDDRMFGLLMHLGGLFVGFLVPLVMWLIKKDESPFLDQHGRDILNWHISLLIYGVISFVLIIVLIGLLFLLVLAIMHFVFSILGAVAANKGETYRYPFALPILT